MRPGPHCGTLTGVTVLLFPLMIVPVVMLVLAALVALGTLGPVGWVADVVLVVALVWGGRELWRRARRWWASTKAPELPRTDGY